MYSKYGPAVIGEAAHHEQQEIVRMGKDKYGPAILDHPGAGTAVAEPPDDLEDAAGADQYLNLAEFQAILGGDPDQVAPLLELELGREGGPRKGALQSLRKVEAAGHKRPDVLALIDDHLG
jgi:hypothetical protein